MKKNKKSFKFNKEITELNLNVSQDFANFDRLMNKEHIVLAPGEFLQNRINVEFSGVVSGKFLISLGEFLQNFIIPKKLTGRTIRPNERVVYNPEHELDGMAMEDINIGDRVMFNIFNGQVKLKR